MQLLCRTTNPSAIQPCAHEILSAVPPAIWFIREKMRPHRKGISLPQFRALVLIDRQPETSLSMIADQCSASLPTTSRLIAGLVAKGLVTRKGCCDDRRQLELAITRLGREVLDTAWAGVQRCMETELQQLTDAQRKVIFEAMTLFQKMFGTLELPDRENPCDKSADAVIKGAKEKLKASPSANLLKGKTAHRAAK
jgi:DNA-binding MarR family transcriptional regulator